MKNMRIFLILFICLSCLSCQQKKKAKFTIGVSQCSDDEWRRVQNQEMFQETAFYDGLQLDIKTVKDNSQNQIEDIRSFINQKVDLLIISPNEAEALTPIIEEAYNSGIPVILIERKTLSNNYTAFVGADNLEVGRTAGAYIANSLSNGGNVLEIRGLKGSTSDEERHRGFMEIIEKHPQIKVSDEFHTEWYRKDAENIMKDIIAKKNSKIDIVFAMNDRMALGVYDAAKDQPKIPPIVGIDALPGHGNGLESIIDGKITASIIYPTGGDKIIQIAMNILNGETYKKENILKTAIVDKNNARVINMQYEQLLENQSKLQRMNQMLDHNLARYSAQRIFLYAVVLVLFLTAVTTIVAFLSYRSKSKANRLLEKQNEEIKRQADTLKQQKEEVESLSEQLKEATQAKLVFFTNISHEFKTPLSLIIAPIERLLSDSSITNDQRDMLTLIKRNSNRLLDLISEIIEFRSFENGKMETFFVEADLKSFLEDLTPLFDAYVKEKKVKLEFICDEDVFIVIFDKEKMEKIYFNLLSNAFKHVDVGGNITISLFKQNNDRTDMIQLSVFNTGSYIPVEEQRNIFDRFYKIDNQDGSTGIGLALVSTLVEVHNGAIDVESKENEGTIFKVTIPSIQENVNLKHTEEYNEGEYIRKKINNETFFDADEVILSENKDKQIVLVIEDNADMRMFLRHTLSDEYNVLEAENGALGIDSAIKYIPDIIICDVMMPEKNGFEVCHILKENITTSHIPIVLLTANSLDEQKVIGFESGADAYIPKPFNTELLKIRLRKLIETREKIIKSFAGSLIDDSKKVSLGEMEQIFINKFTKYIEENISDPELSVDEIAKEMGMSRVQLYRKIKSTTNYTPNELIRITRLKKAKLLLSSKTKSISEVAYETGFSSLSYFSKCFKEFFRTSPSDV